MEGGGAGFEAGGWEAVALSINARLPTEAERSVRSYDVGFNLRERVLRLSGGCGCVDVVARGAARWDRR